MTFPSETISYQCEETMGFAEVTIGEDNGLYEAHYDLDGALTWTRVEEGSPLFNAAIKVPWISGQLTCGRFIYHAYPAATDELQSDGSPWVVKVLRREGDHLEAEWPDGETGGFYVSETNEADLLAGGQEWQDELAREFRDQRERAE